MLFRLETVRRLLPGGAVDEVVGEADLRQLLETLGVAQQLGVAPPPQLQLQPQPLQQQLAGAAGGAQAAAGLPRPLPLLHAAALLAAQQAAAAGAQGMLPFVGEQLPLGGHFFALPGFPLHLPGMPGMAGVAAAAAAAPAAAVAAAPAAQPMVPVMEAPPAAAGGGGAGGGSSSRSSDEIANLQEAQSATEDAQQLMAEDFDRLSFTVDGHGRKLDDHGRQLRWGWGDRWPSRTAVCLPSVCCLLQCSSHVATAQRASKPVHTPPLLAASCTAAWKR